MAVPDGLRMGYRDSMIHFWQRDMKSIENSATFIVQTCISCARFYNASLRPAARPICILPSYDAAEQLKHYNDGHPYYYELPEWDPLGCSYHMDK